MDLILAGAGARTRRLRGLRDHREGADAPVLGEYDSGALVAGVGALRDHSVRAVAEPAVSASWLKSSAGRP